MKINIVNYNSLILSLYLNSFIFVILFLKMNIKIPVLFFFLFFSIINLFYKKFWKKKLMYIGIFFIFIFTSLLFYFEYKEVFKNVFILLCGTLTNIFFINLDISLENLKKYLKRIFIIFLIVLFYIATDKQLYYGLKHMVFGYNCLIIVLFSAYFYQENSKKRYILLNIICNILLLFMGNRFSLLLGVLGSLFFFYFSKNRKLKVIIKMLIILFVPIIFNLKILLKILIDGLRIYELNITGIERLYDYLAKLSTGKIGFFGVRAIWYKETLTLIKENIMLGTGILGYLNKIPTNLYNKNGTFYPHNIFLEILMHFGIIGLIVFFIIIFLVIRKIYLERKKGYKIDNIYFIFVILSLKLLLSNSYLFEKWFWFMLLIPFNNSYYNKC